MVGDLGTARGKVEGRGKGSSCLYCIGIQDGWVCNAACGVVESEGEVKVSVGISDYTFLT